MHNVWLNGLIFRWQTYGFFFFFCNNRLRTTDNLGYQNYKIFYKHSTDLRAGHVRFNHDDSVFVCTRNVDRLIAVVGHCRPIRYRRTKTKHNVKRHKKRVKNANTPGYRVAHRSNINRIIIIYIIRFPKTCITHVTAAIRWRLKLFIFNAKTIKIIIIKKSAGAADVYNSV